MKDHHEKGSGGGYPDSLEGEQIPMQARIGAIADTFDAMTTNRPYQKAMELGYVVEKIKSFAGTRFDPRVVDAMTTNRPYQKAMELGYVVEKIKSFAGTRFDPRVVDAMTTNRPYQKAMELGYL